jgi:hypothetical protein
MMAACKRRQRLIVFDVLLAVFPVRIFSSIENGTYFMLS